MAAQRPWALVTGGSSGIGLAFSRQLASEGWSLALVSNRQDELSEAAKVLPTQVETLCIDLTETSAAERVLAWCDGLGLEPELLVNDAGMFFMEYLEPGNLGKARAMMRLHIEALTELCILFGTQMKERGTGQIINLSSMTARIPSPGIAVYSASKSYVKSFSRGLSYELRPYGVRVLAVCPSAIDTGLYPLGDGLRKFLRCIGVLRSPEWLVRRSLKALRHGRRCISPGVTNFLVPALVALLPARLIDYLGLRWIKR